jgi:hypothetical protein
VKEYLHEYLHFSECPQVKIPHMAQKITRSRAIQSGLLQMLGGVLIFTGVLASGAVREFGWQAGVGTAVSFYFVAAGGYRAYIAFTTPAIKK